MVADSLVNVLTWVYLLTYVASWAIPYQLAKRAGWVPAAAAVGAWTLFGYIVFSLTPFTDAGTAIAAAVGAFTLPWAVGLGLGLMARRRRLRELSRA